MLTEHQRYSKNSKGKFLTNLDDYYVIGAVSPFGRDRDTNNTSYQGKDMFSYGFLDSSWYIGPLSKARRYLSRESAEKWIEKLKLSEFGELNCYSSEGNKATYSEVKAIRIRSNIIKEKQSK